MVDNRFYRKSGTRTLKNLVEKFSLELSDNKFADLEVSNLSTIEDAKEGDICFLQNPKYNSYLAKTSATACVVNKSAERFLGDNDKTALLFSDNPYYAFSLIMQELYSYNYNYNLNISPKAEIALDAEIGDGTVISAGVSIGSGCIIGKNCYIHPNVVISHSIIGDNCIIHPNTSIGQDGFGYAFANGKHNKVLQLGRVVIANDVEIGSNCSIDRGTLRDTIIGQGTKIDNQVQIGHNVNIGKHCIIVSLVGIAGSANIGNYCVIGGQVGIAGHLNIGDNVQIAAQSGVNKDLPANAAYSGVPAINIKDSHRRMIAVDKLAGVDRASKAKKAKE